MGHVHLWTLIFHEGAKHNISLVTFNQLQRQILLNTKSQCMNKSTFLANTATVMQLQRKILKNTKSHCMKWRCQNSLYILNLWSYYKWIICKSSCGSHLFILANIAAIKWIKMESLKDTKSQYIKELSIFSNIAAIKQLW